MKKRVGAFLNVWIVCSLLAVLTLAAEMAAPAKNAAAMQSGSGTRFQEQVCDGQDDASIVSMYQAPCSCIFHVQMQSVMDNLSVGQTSGLIPAPPLQGATIPRERTNKKSAA